MKVKLRAVATASAVATLLAGCGAKEATPASPPEVTVARVLERQVKDWDEFTGRFQAPESVEIRPRVSGYIDSVEFKEGKQVHAGDVLFRIDPRPYRAEFERAKGDLSRFLTARPASA